MTSSSGRVSIAATRDSTGHADHFWSLALALHAARTFGDAEPPTLLRPLDRPWRRPFFQTRKYGLNF